MCCRQLAADQVERLDAVGAFVDLGDAGVAHELLHAVLADVAVAAVDLHAEVGGLEADVGEERLDDRRHQRDEIVGLLPLPPASGCLLDDVDAQRRPSSASARQPSV